jgi:hypothetical protein
MIKIGSKSTIADAAKVPALPREAIERALCTTGAPAQDIRTLLRSDDWSAFSRRVSVKLRSMSCCCYATETPPFSFDSSPKWRICNEMLTCWLAM